MGPFKKGINNYFATMCLKRCQRIYARGQITADHLSMLAIPKHKIQMATDLGFAYQSKYCLLLKKSTEVKEIVEDLVNIKNSSSNKIVAILPSVVKLSMDGNSYLGQMYSLLDYIMKLDYQIVILPNAFRDNVSSLHNNDYSLIEHLHQYVKSVSKRSPTSVLFSCSTEDIRSIVGISDHIITSRFHGMINALSLGKAPLVLSWSHKYFEILDSFELNWLDIDNYVEKEELVAKFEKLVSQQEYYDHQVALFQSKMKLEASQIFHDISAQLSDQE